MTQVTGFTIKDGVAKIETSDALGATTIAAVTDGFIYGFDPARGEDCAVRNKLEKQPDGTLKLLVNQRWNKKLECWE